MILWIDEFNDRGINGESLPAIHPAINDVLNRLFRAGVAKHQNY